ncbi:DNA polymerase ligase N-terminal domain-containing protein [Amycolatopsis sp. cg5]|uniref:DNA polymerase ligase N-terminal domain-containing protein n=1 Tax=Amycolatopsis sp. cg5 TaxID=3238802 RepID=UPI00352606F0
MGELSEYRGKRDPERTPEPVPQTDELVHGDNDVFVIQEHHARRLHWDIRMERDGVLASWAVPMGLPSEPGTMRLAVHTEDHPLEYATFSGEIPAGEYGAGKMLIWDHGRYETLHWNDHKVEVVFHGERARGKYLFLNRHDPESERDWLLQRVDPPEAGHTPLPPFIAPMLARTGKLPSLAEDGDWAYEFDWSGRRMSAKIVGGRCTLVDDGGSDVTALFPELRSLGEQLGSAEVYLDGEVIVLENGKPSPGALDRRMGAARSQAKRLSQHLPALYLPFDVLHHDGRSCADLPYVERRRVLGVLDLNGPHCRIPDFFVGDGGAVAEASVKHGLAGIIAKRAASTYQAGKASADWLAIAGVRVRDVVIGGWRPGGGKRASSFASLLLGIPHGDALRYVGNVGAGFSENDLVQLTGRLKRSERKSSPFHAVPPGQARDAHWVTPRLVGEVVFTGWTKAGCVRTPRWRGLCPGREAGEVTDDA